MTTPAEPRIRIVVVDDHTLVRAGVREILESRPDLAVVAEAADSAGAVAAVAEHRPDIVLLDVELPGGEVTETVTRMRSLSPRSRVIIVSMHDGALLLQRLIAAGVHGYLNKGIDREELVSAIRTVHKGQDRAVLAISMNSLSQMHGRSVQNPLSEREQEVLTLVAGALSNSQIASRLHITEATVKRHLRNVFVKLGAVSRIDAVNKAIEASLLADRKD